MFLGLAIVSLLIFVYGTLAVKLGRWSITMPMIFMTAGFLLGPGVSSLLPLSFETEGMKTLTEVTLAVLLFADASTLDLRQLRHDKALTARLLGIGMPLTMLLGTAVIFGLLPGEGIAFAALLGIILAPTDAALGLPIFNDPKVPVRIRRALNVESGLNDGIATPFVLLFLSLATAGQTHAHSGWLVTALLEIIFALLVGALVGIGGGWLLSKAADRGWTSGISQQLAIFGLALAAFFGSLMIDGNGFIAAFSGGIIFSAATGNRFSEPAEFTENAGTLLSLLVWGIFGGLAVPKALFSASDWRPFACAVLSLTAVRMLPVALAMRRTGLRSDTIALMGWFGPRGLASVVFSLLAVMTLQDAGRPTDLLISTATWTILLSVLAHGLSAKPLSAWYSRRLANAVGPLPELQELSELRERSNILRGGHKR
ncbi:MAG: sodium:proton antiporter [Deltaproteobacteria bacterium]|nr:sodium:proton antiporter [Deltaproteobacteria bacterium]